MEINHKLINIENNQHPDSVGKIKNGP